MKSLGSYIIVVSLFICLGCKKEDTPTPLQVVAAFEVSNTSPEVDELITFTNNSENATSFEWNFGDGNLSTKTNPTHAFAQAGSFIVTLTATGDGGSSTSNKEITVVDLTPIADFKIDRATAAVGETITFTNTSQNAATYQWNFGDGNTSTEINATHKYSGVGTYTVSLTAFNNALESSIERTVDIEIPINIYPGEKIRGLTLGEIWGSVKNMEGYDFTEFGPVIIGSTILHPIEEQSMGIQFYLLGSQILKQDSDPILLISVEAPFSGITEEGIGLGSTLADVQAAYGNEEEISNNNYRYTSLGIDFTIESSVVEEITIYRP